MISVPRFVPVAFAFAALLLLPTVPAQAAAPVRPLITQPINDNQRVTLAGNTRPEARRAAYDRGAVAEDFPMDHLWLALKRSPEQEQALDTLIDQLHNPASPMYHQWLTAKEFGQTFGVAQSDISQVSGWLTGHGFKVDAVFPNQMFVEFSGNAAMVREAFHTEIHHLNVRGEQHYANISDPQIPAALAAAVNGVVSMNDFKPHGDHKRLTENFHDPVTGELVERAAAEGPTADYTAGTGASATYSLVPQDAQTIYNLAPIYSAGVAGEGQTIALLQDTDDYSDADFSTFRTKFGLSTTYPKGNLLTVHPSGSAACTDPGTTTDDDEAELDMEMATAIAPNATIELVSCKGGANFGGLIGMQNMINGTVYPPVVSMSYGVCEAVSGATQNAAFSTTFQQAAAQGISVFASSGDDGAADCEESLDGINGANNASHGINVTGWGESAYNVSVGGTDFQDGALKQYSKYWSSTNGSNFGSAKSYIPEIPWDSSCASSIEWQYAGAASALAYCNSTAGEKILNYAAASSGFSSCYSGAASITGDGNSGTCAGLAKPSWQSGVYGIPNDGKRDVPDVSLFAASGIWSHYWTICFSDPSNNGKSCSGAPSAWYGLGGTSASTPVMAAIQLLIDQKYGAQGNPNYVYYALASVEYGTSGDANCNSNRSGGPAASCVFYDVTTGDNDVNCLGTINCFLPQGQTNGLLSASDTSDVDVYVSGTGYDLATGIGSVNAGNLFTKWGTVGTGGKIGTTLALLVSENPVPQGSPETLIAMLAFPSGSAPTGAVKVSVDGATALAMTCSGTSSPLTCSVTVPTTSLSTGSHSFVVTYAGSANNYPSNATGAFVVTTGTATSPATSVTVKDVYDVANGNGTGGTPTSLMQASDGNYYATLASLSASSPGGVIKFAAGTFTPTILHTFDAYNEGVDQGGLVEGPDGVLYGLTTGAYGGGGSLFYSITTAGKFTALHQFTASDAAGVQAQMVLGSDGNFYVATSRGMDAGGYGSIVQISLSGNATVLYSFPGNDQPQSRLVEATPGVFYGGAEQGGANGYGYLYKFVVNGSTATFTDIHDFNLTDGNGNYAAIIVGADGYLYEIAPGGGSASPGDGVFFKMTSAGKLTQLYDFANSQDAVGSFPTGFILGSDGNFYGDELEQPGGQGNYQSTIWALTPSGTFSVPSNPDGSETGKMVDAFNPILQASDGTYLQPTDEGGVQEGGDLVQMTFTPAQKGPVQLTVSGTPTSGSPFTLNYSVLNGYSTTYQQCYGYVQGGVAAAGTFTGKLTNGSATIIPLAAGTYTYAVTCGGVESGFAKVTVAQGPGKLATTTTLSATPNPVTQGASTTLTATVTAASGTPGGTVTFNLGTLSLGTANLVKGVATLTASTSGYAAGTYAITASYGGSTNFAGSVSTLTNIIVAAPTRSATTVTVTANPNPVSAGKNTTIVATVTGKSPSGTVALQFNGSTLATVNLSGGKATFVVSDPDAGTYKLTFVYSGDANNLGSSSAPFSLTITKAVTTTTIAVNPTSVASGGNATFTATVTGPGAQPTGTITFESGGVNHGPFPLTAKGTNSATASYPISTQGLAPAEYGVTAVYNGDSENLTSTSGNVNLTVTAAAKVTITANPNPVTVGQDITITITVAPNGYSGPTPTGSVKLLLDGVNYGTLPLVNGVATVTQNTTGYPAGSFTLNASYFGDGTYPAANAPTYTVTVVAGQ